MAQKVNIVLIDDLDGSDASETVTFGLDGTTYEIDLNEDNAQALRDSLAGYVGNARKVAGSRRGAARKSSSSSSASSSSAASGTSAAEIREWARSNGYDVPERGRIPAEIREAFESAS
jgi:hypothetical protein